MEQEYINQALAVADSFYNLGFAQGLAFGVFIAFMVYIKVSDWLLERTMRLFKSHIDAYYRHQKILRDLRFLCELNGAPFKPRTVQFLITR